MLFVSFTLFKIQIFIYFLASLIVSNIAFLFRVVSYIYIYHVTRCSWHQQFGIRKAFWDLFFLVNSYFSSCQSAKISEMTSLHWEQTARKGGTASFKEEKSFAKEHLYITLSKGTEGNAEGTDGRSNSFATKCLSKRSCAHVKPQSSSSHLELVKHPPSVCLPLFLSPAIPPSLSLSHFILSSSSYTFPRPSFPRPMPGPNPPFSSSTWPWLFHHVFLFLALCINGPFSFLPLSPLLQCSPCLPSRFSAAYRRIYPPDDKLLLEKYESLLSAAFQTFLAGRAASLQKEMNNPLKRMKARTSMTHTYLKSVKPAERQRHPQNIHKDMSTGTQLWKRKCQRKHTFQFLSTVADKIGNIV